MAREQAFDELYDRICVGLGFCGGLVDGKIHYVTDYIPETGPITAEQFVKWVFDAEGYSVDDPHRTKFHSALKQAFTECMGCDCVDARALKFFEE
jgi:hypothetical protein